MTPEELDQSKIRVHGPPEGYNPEQGDKSNFDWMTYQIKELEKILGTEATADWINRPHSQLCDNSPAAISLKSDSDEGCKIVAQLIADLITDAPENLKRCLPVNLDLHLKEIVKNMPTRMAIMTKILKAFKEGWDMTSSSAAGTDMLMETIVSIYMSINDEAWQLMLAQTRMLLSKFPDSKSIQSTSMVMEALTIQRAFIIKQTSEQQGPIRFIF